MAEVVYTTAAGSDDAANTEKPNGIFSGASFFVAMQVPSRSHILGMIKVNGGSIAQIDKKADFILVDHMKPGVAHNSPVYSYKFIEDCVRNKRLEDFEKYDIENYKKSKKPTQGSKAKPTKTSGHRPGGRAAFTKEDDEILLNWLARPGVTHLKGMKLYIELAERYPQHTHHSWRSRWVEKYMLEMPDGPKPRTKITFTDENDDSDVEFTREDDIILLNMKDEIIKAKNSKLVYEKLHKQHPQHSVEQWKVRFNSVVLPASNKRNTDKPPVNEGIREDVSPRSMEKSPGLQQEGEDSNPELVYISDDHVAITNSEPHPQKEDPGRRASVEIGQIANASMRQDLSISADNSSPRGRKATSLPPAIQQDTHLVVSSLDRPSKQKGMKAQPSTPLHHASALAKPPPSPKGHPMVELPLSPARNDPSDPSPAKDLRVHRWVADVSNRADDEDSSVDDQIATQIKNEIKNSSPGHRKSPTPVPTSPSSAIEVVLVSKRKRAESVHESTDQTMKRSKTGSDAQKIAPTTPKNRGKSLLRQPSKYPQTPPPKLAALQSHKKPSESTSDVPSSRGSASESTPSAGKPTKALDEALNTQALYDQIGEDDEPLLNEEIPGLDDDSSDDDSAAMRRNDGAVFGISASSGVPSRKQISSTLDFSGRRSSPDLEVNENDSDGETANTDPEAIEKEEAEISKYLAEKAQEFGLREEDVIEAIERTSGEKRLVDVVLKSIKEGHGIPTNVKGVYTPEEDLIVTSNDGKAIAEVEKRHGDVLERIAWLERYMLA
ncbi:TRF2-interacting telomeric protein/Rap1 C terminal domain-containing protein [Peziza echinospora]|nr:TRF2-interacting telomeric protein/Rap1 C terminal domain-containing protein [Peziza echinospora]